MTVVTTAVQTDWMPTDGVTKNWPFNFSMFDTGMVVVQTAYEVAPDGAVTEFTSNLALVHTNESLSAGYVTYPVSGSALPAGRFIRIVRRVPYKQEALIGREGDFSPEIHERALDRLTMQTQQIAELQSRLPTFAEVEGLVARAEAAAVVIMGSWPEFHGAVGNGIDFDDTAVLAWVAYCNSHGITAYGTPGKVYRCFSSTVLALTVPYIGRGAEFTVPNNGQNNHLFGFDSLEDDIEEVSIATLSACTGLKAGSNRIPELTDGEWAYWFMSTDDVFLRRGDVPGGSDGQAYGEAFVVTDNLGYLAAPLVRTYATPFTNLTCYRRKLREFIKIEGLRVRVVAGTSDTMNRVVINKRPRTIFDNCHVLNESGDNVQQGFVCNETALVYFTRSTVFGLEEIAQQYGFGFGYSTLCYMTECTAGQCRRDQDGTGATYIFADKCVFPNGGGGHWIDNLLFTNCILGHRNLTNSQTIHYSGSNVMALNCDIHLSAGVDGAGYPCKAMNMRADLPEAAGYSIIRGGTVTVYDEDNTITTGNVTLMKYDAFNAADYGRTVKQPDYIEFKPDLLIQKGSSSNNSIYVVALGCPMTIANVPNDVEVAGKVVIEPGKVILEAGEMNGADPRLLVSAYKSEQSVGDSEAEIVLRNIKTPFVFISPFNASATQIEGRYNILVEDAGPLARYELRYGACKIGRLRRCAQVPSGKLVRTGPVAALKDEAIDYEDFGAAHKGLLLNPFGAIIQRGNALTLADGNYGPDGWIALSSGGNVETATGADINNDLPFVMQYKQLDATARKVGAVSFIPSSASKSLRGRLATLLAQVMLTVDGTLNYAIIEWTGTANAPTRDPVNNWADPILAAGNFFAANYNVLASGSIALTANAYTLINPLYAHVGSTCNNLAVIFWSNDVLAEDAYFRLATDLFPGFERPFFKRRDTTRELERCLPWYRKMSAITIDGSQFIPLGVPTVKTAIVNATVGTLGAATLDGVILTHSAAVPTTLTFAADI